jgi:hypothetical protein
MPTVDHLTAHGTKITADVADKYLIK